MIPYYGGMSMGGYPVMAGSGTKEGARAARAGKLMKMDPTLTQAQALKMAQAQEKKKTKTTKTPKAKKIAPVGFEIVPTMSKKSAKLLKRFKQPPVVPVVTPAQMKEVKKAQKAQKEYMKIMKRVRPEGLKLKKLKVTYPNPELVSASQKRRVRQAIYNITGQGMEGMEGMEGDGPISGVLSMFGLDGEGVRRRTKKQRSPAQRAATARLVAMNKMRRAGDGEMMGMDGGAWYDDLARGFKMGASLGTAFLPKIL